MDIAIGTLREEPKLDAAGQPIFDVRDRAIMSGVGQRVVHSNVLEKTINLMSELGEQEAKLAACRWRDGPGKVPGPTALFQALKKAAAHRQTFLDKGMAREAAYSELAAFCVQCCMDEAKA